VVTTPLPNSLLSQDRRIFSRKRAQDSDDIIASLQNTIDQLNEKNALQTTTSNQTHQGLLQANQQLNNLLQVATNSNTDLQTQLQAQISNLTNARNEISRLQNLLQQNNSSGTINNLISQNNLYLQRIQALEQKNKTQEQDNLRLIRSNQSLNQEIENLRSELEQTGTERQQIQLLQQNVFELEQKNSRQEELLYQVLDQPPLQVSQSGQQVSQSGQQVSHSGQQVSHSGQQVSSSALIPTPGISPLSVAELQNIKTRYDRIVTELVRIEGLMVAPVITKSGATYDLATILHIMKTQPYLVTRNDNSTSIRIAGTNVDITDIRPNRILRNILEIIQPEIARVNRFPEDNRSLLTLNPDFFRLLRDPVVSTPAINSFALPEVSTQDVVSSLNPQPQQPQQTWLQQLFQQPRPQPQPQPQPTARPTAPLTLEQQLITRNIWQQNVYDEEQRRQRRQQRQQQQGRGWLSGFF
jgi:hypothetical protein